MERREEYMAALEKASVEGDIEGVGRFVGGGDEIMRFFCKRVLLDEERFVFLQN